MQLETISTGDLAFTEKVNRNFQKLSFVNKESLPIEVNLGNGLSAMLRRFGTKVELMIVSFTSVYFPRGKVADHYVAETIPLGYRPRETIVLDTIQTLDNNLGATTGDLKLQLESSGRIKWILTPGKGRFRHGSSDVGQEYGDALFGILPTLMTWVTSNSPLPLSMMSIPYSALSVGHIDQAKAINDEFLRYRSLLPTTSGAEALVDIGHGLVALCRRFGNEVWLVNLWYQASTLGVGIVVTHDVSETIPYGFRPTSMMSIYFMSKSDIYESPQRNSTNAWHYPTQNSRKFTFSPNGKITWSHNSSDTWTDVLPFGIKWNTSDAFPREHSLYRT